MGIGMVLVDAADRCPAARWRSAQGDRDSGGLSGRADASLAVGHVVVVEQKVEAVARACLDRDASDCRRRVGKGQWHPSVACAVQDFEEAVGGLLGAIECLQAKSAVERIAGL